MNFRDTHIIEGGHDARVKLNAALGKFISGPDASNEPLELSLLQCAKMGEMPVNKFSYDFEGSIDETVKEIVEAAEEDAAEHRGKVKYAVRIDGRSFRTIFSLKIPDLDDDDDDYEDLDDLPNRRGLISQQMKHNEVFAKEMIASSKSDRSFMAGMLRDLMAENALLKKQWFEGQAVIENLRNMQWKRDLDLEELRKKEQRKDQVAGMLLQTGPMLASHLLGGGAKAAEQGGPAAVGQRTPLENMVEGLFASFEQRPEKLQKIAELLDPVELANLAGIHKYIAERREKEEELRRAQNAPSATNGQSNGRPYSPYTAPPANHNGTTGQSPPYTGANGANQG